MQTCWLLSIYFQFPWAQTCRQSANETAPLAKNYRIRPFLTIKAQSCNRHQNKLKTAIYLLPLFFKTQLQTQSIWKKAAGETMGMQSISGSFFYPGTLRDMGRSKHNTPPPWWFLNIILFLSCSQQLLRLTDNMRKLFGGVPFASSPSCINKLCMNHLFLEQLETQFEGQKHLLSLKMNYFSHFAIRLVTQTTCYVNAKQRAMLVPVAEKGKIQDVLLCPHCCGSGQRESCRALS